MTYFTPQKIALWFALFVVAGSSVFFRNQVSELLRFGDENPPIVYTKPIIPPKKIPTPPEASKAPRQDTISFQPVPTPTYTGRDPEEIRPVPDEVKLFNDVQKQQLFATVRIEGQIVKKNPEQFQSWMKIGLLKKTIGDFEGARDAWEYAGIIQPLNSISFTNLGELYWRYLHEYQKSETNFQRAMQNNKFDTQNYVSLAELYHYSYKEKHDMAPNMLLDGLKELPDDETLSRRLAYLYEQRGEFSDALSWWEKVLTRNPGDTEVGNKVEKLRERLKKS